ncbi:tRNA (5-methyl aminomethyl-2-thiouridylate)-methyltransferase [Salinisphaera sp. PC39]|uniref:tRNA 2-thiouridine(34) synthase MnmA n=1 Tax=Salinisphaera sp. PC39 TaxID=1304156 RepID=UPI003341E923
MSAPRHVIVGLSGGVDSAVAALRLREAGHRVEGLFMFNWTEDEAGRCSAAADYEDAAAVCEVLGIPLHRADFSREYRDRVFAHFLDAYAHGHTPNPDVLCNREIKFDVFLNHARRLGADAIATGHYARSVEAAGGTRLLRGVDPGKDQSYFLAAVPETALERTLFPLGGERKSDVREAARAAGLPVHAKPDSTGVCFIGERDFAGFLSQYLPARPGPIRVADGPRAGDTVARHNGLMFHTLGQRRGLGVGGIPGTAEAPWYVVAKDLADNTLWISQDPQHPMLLCETLEAEGMHWIGPAPATPLRCEAQVRYRQRAEPCTVETLGGGVRVTFDRPQRAVAPGQFVVLYDGEHCLGGAEIRRAHTLAGSRAA